MASPSTPRNFATPWPFSADTMNVSAKASLAFTASASFSSFSTSTVSILFSTRKRFAFPSAMRARMASLPSSRPRRASSSSATASASPPAPQAACTMARSSRRFGAKMPGVSTKTTWAGPWIAMPRTGARVVCTLRDTIDTFEPTRALISVDLPALGMPISAAKPQRVGASAGEGASVMVRVLRPAAAGGRSPRDA